MVALIMGSPQVTRAAVVGVEMGVAAVSRSWSGSDGVGFDDVDGGKDGGPEPIFRRFLYGNF